MPDHEFLFALDMSAGPPFDMLAELARTVLAHVGYGTAVNRVAEATLTRGIYP